MAWLYRFELKGIQRYVLSSSRLRQILGASALIEELSSDILRTVLETSGGSKKDIMYAAAGGATIRFGDDETLRKFASTWPLVVALAAPGLQFVQAWTPSGGDSTSEMPKLFSALEQARSRPAPALPPMTPILDNAPGSSRPALANVTDKDGRYLDAAGASRERAGSTDSELLRRLSRRFRGKLEADLPFEVDEIAGGEAGYVAVIHADGNSVGQRVLKLAKEGPEAVAQFSACLSEATEAAVQTAVASLRLTEGKKPILPARPVVIGGDDITVIVRANQALDFVTTYARAFERECKNRKKELGGRLTASAGVAFVRGKHPFRAAYDLAEHLCSEAKREGKAVAAKPTPSLVCFERITASLGHLASEDNNQTRGLGPYLLSTAGEALTSFPPIEEIRSLAKVVGSRNIGRGPFRELLHLAEQASPAEVDKRLERALSVLKPRERDQLTQRLQSLDAALVGSFWTDIDRADESGDRTTVKATPWYEANTLVAVGSAGA